MKYYKTLGLYKASNVDYQPSTGLGHSYKWYELARKFNGKQILNAYRYSPTTGQHVAKLRKLFQELSISYIEIEAPHGLQRLDIAQEHYVERIKYLQDKINNPRSKKALKPDREAELARLTATLSLIESLIGSTC